NARATRLKGCFAMIPFTKLMAVCGSNAIVKVGVALHCQGMMQGRKRRIIPYTAWRKALNVQKRAYLRAIATLEKRHLIRRHRRGPGRKFVIELIGPLAQFVSPTREKPSKKTQATKKQLDDSPDDQVWNYLSQ